MYRPEKLGRVPDDTTNGVVSAQRGLEQLVATDIMATPQGIKRGSSMSEVRTAYGRPGLSAGDAVVVDASSAAVYRIELNPDVVTSISLELRKRDCTI